ncbi:fungal class II heme-containing peroxidase [Oleoguttula sp. CCFEE 5521]
MCAESSTAGFSSLNTPYAPASGGADGSLLLNDEEIARREQDPLQEFRRYLLGKWKTYKSQNVSAADVVQVAASLVVRSCPGGPLYKTVVGRIDDANAAPDGNLPDAFGPGSSHDVLISLWADKGINPRGLAALMGAHSISRAFAQAANGIRPGSPQDDTPRVWDTTYFNQTQAVNQQRGISRFDSDVNLGRPGTMCGGSFTEFAANADAWATAFSAAAYKMSIMGIPQFEVDSLVDCTGVVQ